MSYNRLLLLLFVQLLPYLAGSQSVEQALKDYFTAFEKGTLSVSSLRRLQAEQDRVGTLKHFARYTGDSLESVRLEAYRLVGSYSLGIKGEESRRVALRYLIGGIYDRSVAVSRVVVGALTKFAAVSYGRQEVQELIQLLGRVPDRSSLFRLVAYVGDSSVADTLRAYRSAPLSKEEQWSLNLALARAGDSQATQSVLEVVQQHMGRCTELVKLLPDLSYTRSRAILDVLLAAAVEDKLECRSPNPSSEVTVPFGVYAYPYLSGCIRSFPVVVDESGDLEEEYGDAAAAVKAWYAGNRGSYQINRSSYR